MEKVIEKTLELLNKDNEWESRYEGYIYTIIKTSVRNVRRPFKKPEGLSLYSSVSRRDGRTFDLRFDGQSVAEVVCKKNGVFLCPRVKANKDYFEFKQSMDDKELKWHSEEASDFRKVFQELSSTSNDIKLKSPEHRVENRLLEEFKKGTRAQGKALCNIQPVLLYNCFFQLPTPLKASTHAPSYAAHKGGGVDILARVVTKNNEHRLCVMEVKDENKEEESQEKAMEQAITYAVFLAKLLHSKSGQMWWNFFMNRKQGEFKQIPQPLNIDVVTIMPDGSTKEFCNQQIEIPEVSTILHCHSLYYDDDKFDKGKGKIVFSAGTYLNELKN